MPDPWLIVAGVGEDAPLSREAEAYIKKAPRVVGGRRLLDKLAPSAAERHIWPSPLADILPRLHSWRGDLTLILATGDPLLFGVGNFLLRHFAVDEMKILPAVSSFALARARLGWGAASARTLHGRPPDSLRSWLGADLRLLVLPHDGDTPRVAARILREEGYGRSDIHILEHMGGDGERIRSLTADELLEKDIDDIAPFHLLGIHCVADAAATLRSPMTLIDDSRFRHDGQITKSEMRALALARLEPYGEGLLWDLGAGAGSVSVGWLRMAPLTRALAIERDGARVEMVRENAVRFGVPRLEVCEEDIDDFLSRAADLPAPDAIFFGGGLSTVPRLIERGLNLLSPRGRVVAHSVTLEGEETLARAHRDFGGELLRVMVSRAESLGDYRGWRARMPVLQWYLAR
ncbi:MAG: precorrin-6y C5,15-methyltransferase (decarboxylating) subunit CbiE [Alphaproteobacteria bacterium]|nr:precorrin-6y C5,15-methyltransferase (decarboxylating) subunit CbiE [Alphaproteobacteria bacterium]MDA8004051.1 precorrin-6y C5,15-methyltransferase (decarboxylating) subunit CbiE [Alphaproteobacteria bacterium]MDA8005703.1 precorrin-6y C5,15-methyltransferase (decarboxylating) subunit CbiE [Alphaproteobacteria bacterium]MDA8013056.1 precorrin-6y C5,15-methyltransferase (decarboxylating) subunit CbiE [Alphaproteobacteria bacterium]